MGILNGVMPILTDSILLVHIAIERIENAKSPWRLAMIMAAPVFLKFGRLANVAIYIAACAEFVLSSVTSGDGVPDMEFLSAAQAQSMQIACTLQMIDNSFVELSSPVTTDNDPHPQIPTRALLSQRVRATAQDAPRSRTLYVPPPSMCAHPGFHSRRAEPSLFRSVDVDDATGTRRAAPRVRRQLPPADPPQRGATRGVAPLARLGHTAGPRADQSDRQHRRCGHDVHRRGAEALARWAHGGAARRRRRCRGE